MSIMPPGSESNNDSQTHVFLPGLAWSIAPESKTGRWNRSEFGYGGSYVYLMRNRVGQVLYVGMTGNPVERWRRHAQRKPWWPEVAVIEFETRARESVALELERELIRSLAPLHNIRSAVARG